MGARQLSTAEERRVTVIDAAVAVFAKEGFHGTRTLDVAVAAGISHAYLFRLFPTKAELFIATAQRAWERTHRALVAAAAHAATAGRDPMAALHREYERLMTHDRDALLVQLHSQAAASDPVIGDAVRTWFAERITMLRAYAGEEHHEIQRFCAVSALMNVMAAIDASADDDRWATLLAM